MLLYTHILPNYTDKIDSTLTYLRKELTYQGNISPEHETLIESWEQVIKEQAERLKKTILSIPNKKKPEKALTLLEQLPLFTDRAIVEVRAVEMKLE